MAGSDQTVYILDDDEAMRDALRELLTTEGLQVQTFVSADAFLRWDMWKNPGCAIADIHMPGMTGLELLAELKKRDAKISVIVITGQGDVPKAVTALKAGAVDFLEKPFDPNRLLALVKKELEGVGQKQREQIELDKLKSFEADLTPREREVMDLIVAGNSNKVVAAKLNISARTVETHRAKMMEKMQCDNLSSLVTAAMRLKGASS